jgi:hypothetical protein
MTAQMEEPGAGDAEPDAVRLRQVTHPLNISPARVKQKGRPKSWSTIDGSVASALDAVPAYPARAWITIAIPFKQKAPQGKWGQPIELDLMSKHFNGAPQNIGIKLGASRDQRQRDRLTTEGRRLQEPNSVLRVLP